jgi:hypothetical protein
MSETSDGQANRGDLMRQIASLHAQMATGFRMERPPAATGADRQELMRQIVALEKQLMDV